MSESLFSRSDYFLNHLNELDESDVVWLQTIVREHNQLYYTEQSPIISDAEYDALFRMLKHLEERYGIFDPESPTKRIDVLVSGQFQKGLHKSAMISLDNTYDAMDLMDFEKRIRNILKSEKSLRYFVELKFDGLGLSLTYREGRLVRALTRGNGIEGEDVTVNALQIANIPKTIPFLEEVEIRGEVVLPNEEFDRINRERVETGDKLFSNPRNAASGSLRQLDYRVTKSRNLKFFAYSFPYLETEMGRDTLSATTYMDYLGILRSFGFTTTPYGFFANSLDDLLDEILRLTAERPVFGFEIDGLVVKMDDLRLWYKLGTTEHHPRYAIAYKFPATNVRTVIEGIEHSVGRTGIVTPVALLSPVNVGGVTVSRATLHNYDELRKKDIRIGDQVFIIRAGEVIPEVVSVITEARTGLESEVLIPDVCPACSTPLKRNEGKVALFCPNKHGCPAQIQGKLEVFVGKHGMNIDGFGRKLVELLLDKGWITDFVSVYHLNEYVPEMLGLEGFKEKSVSNLMHAIEASRKVELASLLVGLGIPQVGRKTGKVLAKYIAEKKSENSERVLSDILTHLTFEELESVHDIGPIGAGSIVYYFEENEEFLGRLIQELNIVLPRVALPEKPRPLAEKSFCVTGGFENISRDEVHALIEQNGGAVRTSVSPKLDYLVVGSDAGSKLQKAQDLWVVILSFGDLEQMIGNQ